MKPRSIIGTVSLFLLHPATAQEKPSPSLYIPEYDFNVTYRQNVCDRHQGFYNGSVELRHALEGFELHSLLKTGDYFLLDDNGAINETNPGLVASILDELAERGGFTWRNSFAVNDGRPPDNHTWTDLLAWATESYDVSASWWSHSIDRLKLGIGFPEGFVDASYILVGIKEDASSNTADVWTWTEPFNLYLWLAIIVTTIVSGILYEVVEQIGPAAEKKSRKWGIFGASLIFLQNYSLSPRTRAGKVLSLSLAFWSMIILATYTANLASVFVIQNTPSARIQTVDDAINARISMCISEDSAAHTFAKEHYPQGIFVPVPSGDEFEGILNEACGLAFTYVHEWEQVQNDKTINTNCNLEWFGRVINIIDAGFALKADSGRLCTSLVQDVLNLHLVEMTIGKNGTPSSMEGLKKNFQEKTGDNNCAAAVAGESSNQLSFQAMAGPFLVHSIATGLALLLAAVSVFAQRFKRKNLEPKYDDDFESVLAINNVHVEGDPTAEKESVADQATELRGIRRVEKKQDEMMAQLASMTAILKRMQDNEATFSC